MVNIVNLTCNYMYWENSYLLQCSQALVHFQGISQPNGSLGFNFIVAETVKERTLKVLLYMFYCDNVNCDFLVSSISIQIVHINCHQLSSIASILTAVL